MVLDKKRTIKNLLLVKVTILFQLNFFHCFNFYAILIGRVLLFFYQFSFSDIVTIGIF